MKLKGNSKLYMGYEILLVVLALISVIFIWSDNTTILFLDKIVWGIFFADVSVRIIRTNHKWEYIKNHPFDIIAAVPLDSIFQTVKIVRLFRILRLVAVTKHHNHAVFSILKTNGLDKVISFSTILLIGSSVAVYYTEPNIETIADGIWWSLVTTTTVGYGDISPSTLIGRIIAVILMFVGIGLVGMVTGSITTFFVKEKREKRPTVEFIQNQLDNFDELTVAELKEISMLISQLSDEKENDKAM